MNPLATTPVFPVVRFQEGLACVLALAIGLHLPRSFSLLYLLIALILWRSWRTDGPAQLAWLRPWWPVLVVTPLYSLAYVAGMLHWRLWAWSANRADLINALLLPSLMLLCGLLSGCSGWRPLLRLLLSYAIGALLFTLLALTVSRHPWWDPTQTFTLEMQVPWGSAGPVNVRSVEQNAFPALILLPAVLAGLQAPGATRHRVLTLVAGLLGILSLHTILSLEGRLGILVLLLSALPLAGPAIFLVTRHRSRPWLVAVMSSLAVAAAVTFARLTTKRLDSIGWGQGLCDERLSLHLAILGHALTAPWGGRQLLVHYQLCDGTRAMLAPEGGTLAFAHNVVLDVFRDAGLVPVILLLAALLPLVFLGLRGFLSLGWRSIWTCPMVCLWGWFVLLLCQWSFQPLLYADGLLFYLSFFVFAALAAGFSRMSASDGNSTGGSVTPPPALISSGGG